MVFCGVKFMKAILVIDEMPKNCDECPIRFSGEPNEWCWYLKHGLDDIKSKPSWCPLKPLPEKRELKEEWLNEYNRDEFADGWNACLNDITGEIAESKHGM